MCEHIDAAVAAGMTMWGCDQCVGGEAFIPLRDGGVVQWQEPEDSGCFIPNTPAERRRRALLDAINRAVGSTPEFNDGGIFPAGVMRSNTSGVPSRVYAADELEEGE